MPTQEERLSTLEQTVARLGQVVTAFSGDIRDINHNEAMLLGMAVKQGENIREIKVSLASLSERLDTLEQSVNSRFDAIDQRFESVDQRFDAIDQRFDRLEKLIIDRLPPA